MPRKSGAKSKADGSLVLNSAQTGPIRGVSSTRGAKRRRTSNSTDIYGSGTIVATNPFDDDHQATSITNHQSHHQTTYHNYANHPHQQLHLQQQPLVPPPHHHALPHQHQLHHHQQSPTPTNQAMPTKHEIQPMMLQQHQHPQMQHHHQAPNMIGPPITHSPHQHQTQVFHHAHSPHQAGPLVPQAQQPPQASLTPAAQQHQMQHQMHPQQQPQILHHAQSQGPQSIHQHLAPQTQVQPQAQPDQVHQVYSPANYMQSQQPYLAHDQQQQLAGVLYCGVCQREIYHNEQSIICKAGCQSSYHVPCSGLSQMAADLLTKERDHAEWICDRCSSAQRLPYVKYKS